jgi:hypothetical protein
MGVERFSLACENPGDDFEEFSDGVFLLVHLEADLMGLLLDVGFYSFEGLGEKGVGCWCLHGSAKVVRPLSTLPHLSAVCFKNRVKRGEQGCKPVSPFY